MSTDEPLLFRCPNCKVDLKAKARDAGRKGHCPQCGAEVRVPAQEKPRKRS